MLHSYNSSMAHIKMKHYYSKVRDKQQESEFQIIGQNTQKKDLLLRIQSA